MNKMNSINSQQLNTAIHAPNRLKISAILTTLSEIEFKVLKEQLAISDSVLSKHLKVLEESNYVLLKKRVEFGRQRTWVSLTSAGEKAFKAHVAALKSIVGGL